MISARCKKLIVGSLLVWAGGLFAFDALADGKTVFVANPPYSPQIGESSQFIELDGKSRVFDFGGDRPFVNSSTGSADFATINTWNSAAKQAEVIRSNSVPPEGVSGRVFKTGGYTAIGYIRGDGIVEGKLRTQINSFPIPARRRFVWDLSFRVGGAHLGSPWEFTPIGSAPATIWQLKTVGLPPALVMAIDTDPNDSTKLALSFDSRLDPKAPAIRLGDIGGLSPSTEIEVSIDAFLDERSIVNGGKGYLRISVNKTLVVDRWGPVLQPVATFPYHWSVGMYLYSNTSPLPIDRFVYWKSARLFSF